MNKYKWKGISRSNGKKCKGTFHANNEEEVQKYIKERYFIKEIKKHRSWRKKMRVNFFTKFCDKDCLNLFSELSSMLESGMLLINSFIVIEDKSNYQTEQICRKLRKELNNGKSFEQALKSQNGVFSDFTISIVAAGEASGRLDNAMKEISAYYERKIAIKRFVENALIYPILVSGMLLLGIVAFIFKVIPLLLELFSALKIEVTGSLQILENFRGFIGNNGIYLFVIILALFFLLMGDLSKVKRVFFYLPFSRGYMRKVLEIRFCRMLAVLLESGIELPKALRISKKALGNNMFLPSFEESYKLIIDGEEINKAISLNNKLFSETTLEYIGVGEKSGKLVEMLKNASKIVDKELETELVKFKVMLEPVMLILVSILVIIAVYSIAKPIIMLFNTTSAYN